MAAKAKKGADAHGTYIVLNGKRLALKQHPTDFSVIANEGQLERANFENLAPLSRTQMRAAAKNSADRDRLMSDVREKKVAHHIYQVEGTNEEIVIDDRIIVKLRQEGTGELERIIQEYSLVYEGKMGDAHILRLTTQTGMNPLKAANMIAERPGVETASPEVMLDINLHQVPALFNEQWYLNVGALMHPDVVADAGVSAPEAWEITKGSPEIVVAVIDDGFDLEHPALTGVRIHPEKRNFVDGDDDVGSRNVDYHGTPVASIAIGAHHADSPMRGMAPNCTFLPIRIGFGPTVAPIDMLTVFRYVSARADVVNCSFGLSPTSFDPLNEEFRREITKLCETGGRRGKGLVMVFSAANDDAPTFLEGNANVNGVLFTRRLPFGGFGIREIPAGQTVFSGYPLTPGVVVVGAMSSTKRKSGYSCWGPHLTVTAPSNNMHYIETFIEEEDDPRREDFVANYRGLGQIAATNRPDHGAVFGPLLPQDDPSTPLLNERFYTRRFGGTSGAAPVVTGTVALMLSANPELSAQEVRQILMATADTNLDFTLDLAGDRNLQGLPGVFNNGHSLYFGAGKVNAFHAVRRARALLGDAVTVAQPSVMANKGKEAAFEELAEQTLGEISAQQFLELLQSGDLSAQQLIVWPEKKKVELWVEPENIGNIKVSDLITRLRGEKKKLELEVEPPWLPPIIPRNWREEKKKVELELPPDFFRNDHPISSFDELLSRLEERIIARLRASAIKQ